MHFHDRIDAARQLAVALDRYRGRHPLVLAIPRGAVPMGRVIADALGGELDVVLVRKLGVPWQPELAMGAIDEAGRMWLTPHARRIDPHWLDEERDRQLSALRQRRLRYAPPRRRLPIAGREVIVVDDGLATGATMITALRSVRACQPAWLACAVPVAAADALAQVRQLVDDMVCLRVPAAFDSVGAFYRDFRQVEDDEVVACLQRDPVRDVCAPDHQDRLASAGSRS